IAAMRPLPSALHAHLCAALPGADRVDDPSRARMARIIVWAATGSADAEGESNPQAKVSPIGTPLTPGATAPDAAFAAAREFFQRGSAGGSARIDLSLEPGKKISQLIAQVIGEANRKATELPLDVPANEALGNQVIEIFGLLPRTEDWPVAAVTAMQLGA